MITATYSPDDNKLRLYSTSRLDAETYARVRNAGFIYAPKQGLFVAPMWTPAREDLLLELCGEIGDEDTSLVDRAEQRAERFEDYSERRSDDADRAHKAVSSIVEHIPFGQPILVGHHSERRARKDVERIDNGMRRAVKMWETSQYWKFRAEGALLHAKYKELPAVRARRIKKIEAEKRKRERSIQEAQNSLTQWNDPNHELTLEWAKHITSVGYVSACFPLEKYPRELPTSQYEGQMSIWSALDDGVINEVQAKEICVRVHERTIAWSQRWVDHYENRLTYERAMLAESGGLAADKFDLQVGGYVQVTRDWLLILRVNRKDGQIVSVSTDCPYVSVKPVEKIQDYRPPTGPIVKADCPLLNYRSPGDVITIENRYGGTPHVIPQVIMTKAEYMRVGTDYRGTRKAIDGSHKVRVVMKVGQWVAVFLSDSKVHPIPAPKDNPATI
jgi:hypothetical protein